MSSLIELEHISKRFGAFQALNDVNVSIEPGVTGLLGPNGAGKSTLIKILLGLLQPTSGVGRVLNFEIGKQNRDIRANVGYMPEDDCFLFGLTGVEAVQFSAQLSGMYAIEGMRRAHEILDYCGLEQERYRNVDTYSTGMRQKLRFAQAIVHDPPLLILDEPTSGLDPEERDIMLRRIKRLGTVHDKTILICTHILPDVQAVSKAVVILVNGTVRVSDQLSELSRPAEPAINVRVLGDTDAFVAGIAEKGCQTTRTAHGEFIVRGPVEQLTAIVWQVAKNAGVTVRSLAPARNSLEDIFLRAVQERPDGS
ncbi:ABC transporter ATP-binding protein [Planctomycetota bacterium]